MGIRFSFAPIFRKSPRQFLIMFLQGRAERLNCVLRVLLQFVARHVLSKQLQADGNGASGSDSRNTSTSIGNSNGSGSCNSNRAEFVAAAVVVAAAVTEVDARPAFSISNHSNKKCRATLGLLEYVGNFGHLAISKGLAF